MKFFIIVALLIYSLAGKSQSLNENLISTADQFFYNSLKYRSNVVYNYALERNNDVELKYKIAKIYYELRDYDKAKKYFEEIEHFYQEDPFFYYQLSDVYFNTKDNEKNIITYNKFLNLCKNCNMSNAKLYYKSDDSKKNLFYNKTINSFEQNSKKSDFMLSQYMDGYLYLSEKNNMTVKKNGIKYLVSELMYFNTKTKKEEPLLHNVVSSKESILSYKLYDNEQKMYITKQNSDDLEDHNINIYFLKKNEKGEWSSPKRVYIKDKKFNIKVNNINITLNKSNKLVVFSSNIRSYSSIGQFDLWMCERINDTIFGIPSNMGSNINTNKSELYPFFDSRDNLYFSSDASPSYGGMDIFVSKYYGTIFQKAENLGEPINSIFDEYAFNLSDNLKNVSYSTFRVLDSNNVEKNNFSNMDIYTFEVSSSTTPILFTEYKDTFVNNNINGYSLKQMKENVTQRLKVINEISKIAETNADKNVVKISNGIKKNNLQNYYEKKSIDEMDMDQYTIYYKTNDNIGISNNIKLTNLLVLMKKHKGLNIEIASYTDCRSSKEQNLKLSQRRAEKAKLFLLSRGIESNRIRTKWYGEQNIKYGCVCDEYDNYSKCEYEDMEKNRRTEFNIIKN